MSGLPQPTTPPPAQQPVNGRHNGAALPGIEITPPPNGSKEVRFQDPDSSPSASTILSTRDWESSSDAASDGTIQKGEMSEDERGESPMLPVPDQADMDPRLTELQPCVHCKAHRHECDGVPCTECETRKVECTPTRETFEEALDRVATHIEKKITQLESMKGAISRETYLKMISEEISSNDNLRFNFRVHKGKTQLVSYARRCYYCHPDKLPCLRDQDDKRCMACIGENRICRRFAITFTNSDTRLGSVDYRFRHLYEKLTQLKETARHAVRYTDHQTDRAHPIRQTSSFIERPTVSQNHNTSPLSTFPWMAIFDAAITKQHSEGVNDLTQYTLITGVSPACTSGGFADVWKGTVKIDLETHSLNLTVALKQVRKRETRERTAKSHKREMTVWSKLRHPNILPFLGLAEFPIQGPCFVSPWMPNEDARSYLRKHLDADRMRIIRGLIHGLTYLHTQQTPVFHGDIKAQNILVGIDGTPVLCDFGLSVILDDPTFDAGTTTSAQNGSSRWMAPERLNSTKFNLTTSQSRTLAADMFSFGMTTVEIISDHVPFHTSNTIHAAMLILEGQRPTIPEPYASAPAHIELVALIQGCWQEDRSKRPTATEVWNRLG